MLEIKPQSQWPWLIHISPIKERNTWPTELWPAEEVTALLENVLFMITRQKFMLPIDVGENIVLILDTWYLKKINII